MTMLKPFKPYTDDLTPVEKLIVHRIINGSKKQHDAFVEAATRNPKNAARARQLVELAKSEHAAFLTIKPRFYHQWFGYLSLKARAWFFEVLFKSRISPAYKQMKAALSVRAAYESYEALDEHPEILNTFFNERINFQNKQKPIIFANGCIDSRVDMTELLMAQKGEVLVRREPAGEIEGINRSLVIAVKKGVRKVVLVTHGKCSAIEECNDLLDEPRPDEYDDGILWEMAQTKREVFADVHKNGDEFYKARLDIDDQTGKPEDGFLQNVEMQDTVRNMRYTLDLLSKKIKNGNDVTVVSIYMDLRTMNPYLLRLTGPGDHDWELRRLTDHSNIPCAESPEECDCSVHSQPEPTQTKIKAGEQSPATEIRFEDALPFTAQASVTTPHTRERQACQSIETSGYLQAMQHDSDTCTACLPNRLSLLNGRAELRARPS
jgi:carbonic anhydrase